MIYLWSRHVFAALLLLAAQNLLADSAASGNLLQPDALVAQALAVSPALHSARARIDGLSHRVPQSRALPDPVVSVGWTGNPEPFSIMHADPSSGRSFGVSEQFTLASKRRLQAALANKDVEAAGNELESLRRAIALEARTSFYQYLFAANSLQILQDSRVIMQEVVQVATAQYGAGKGAQSDLLRAQLQLSAVLEKQLAFEESKAEALARIHALLLQADNEPLAEPAQQGMLQLPASDSSLEEHAVLLDVDSHAAAIETARNHLAVQLAQKQIRPDLGVSYMVQQRSDQPAMHGVALSLSIPLFAKSKQQQAVAEAASMEHAAQLQGEQKQNNARLEVRRLMIAASSAERIVNLYRSTILPQTRLAVESALAAYRSGKGDLQSVLAAMNATLDAELECTRQTQIQQQSVSAILIMTGHEPAIAKNASALQEEK